LASEVIKEKNSPELPPGDDSPLEVEGLEPAEPESLVAQKDEELAKANARLIELEQIVVGKDGEIADLKQAEAELEERLSALSNSLAEAVASYRTVLVQASPEVVEELVSGDTIEAINESLAQAKDLVSRVRQGVEAEIASARVPAGAPERTSPDLSALSPREKIQYAIGKIR